MLIIACDINTIIDISCFFASKSESESKLNVWNFTFYMSYYSFYDCAFLNKRLLFLFCSSNIITLLSFYLSNLIFSKWFMFFFHHFILESVFMTFWWTTFLNQMMKTINVSSYSLFSSLFTCHVTRFMIAHFWTNVCVFFFEFEHDYSSILFFVRLNLFNVIHVLFSSSYIRECACDVLMINIFDSNDEIDRCFFILVVFFAFYMSYYLKVASFILFVELRIVEWEVEWRISSVKIRRSHFHAWYF
jgi:hypothetical protein